MGPQLLEQTHPHQRKVMVSFWGPALFSLTTWKNMRGARQAVLSRLAGRSCLHRHRRWSGWTQICCV